MTLSCGHGAGFVAAGYAGLFTLGLAGSLHCLGMCGPLSCLVGAGRGLVPYHMARLASYAFLGFLLFKIGAPLRLGLPWPWLLALLSLPLLAYAVLPRLHPPAALGRLHAVLFRFLAPFGPDWRGAGLGLLTPLLPCGLLYAAAGYSLAAPDALTASAWMLAFAAGTFPMLAAGQLGWSLSARIRGGLHRPAFKRATAGLAASAILAYAFMEFR